MTKTERRVGKEIERCLAKEQWIAARRRLHAALQQKPTDHWLLTRLSTTYYERHQYKQSLSISRKAYRLAPACPLVLWDYAGALDMSGHEKQAIKIWQGLLKRGTRKIAYGKCGEGVRWARALINDCRYRIGRSYLKLGQAKLARHYFRHHLKHRMAGLLSLYSKDLVSQAAKQTQKK